MVNKDTELVYRAVWLKKVSQTGYDPLIEEWINVFTFIN